ncbi:MAG: Asp-tRNA(Asn)/Glu-tRNA(Gln) amidotransferase subunit GatB [Rhodospirillales bacterium]|jgi:aspartyl-tRNA(Asn)/glutamyl-tRNA(Gln) amidotransferase subunit B|nr:Asp-tRNA(Asn)/Glu-tRNA(Gln) amidotransferase GatCAB subunit B [Rhodospirillaceae bacterium]MDP6427806.1 Asp-tRNA(Asn)/Glu-tRNA(Gln) amidotransferase subunit GatB [Rhodospirillales bacterium]MDP6644560.1 Asp-tRNA(Asn)/Glu-tRNA(Gln) amidotransferase subunit GatB [Rhodospirillales bacterium]MDP6840306.1 Asp-tRNA(Asn)/Glu-tRNA(Gln) amidotransferase subunit GatB [Rhodospirillales bacterium]
MTYLIEGESGDWEVVIGLEVHAQITSEAKLFSGAATAFGAEPNSQVSLVDAAMPGMLPVINEHCVAQAVKTGLGLNAEINLHSVFERKNYFYPDLPQGYQISQFQYPVVGAGVVVLDMPEGLREIGIERLHMEQDAGKSLHDQDPKRTFIDLNRSGVALMEIVSKPDLRSPDEVGAYLRKLRAILRYLGTCDGNMEQGSLRCDANVSVRHPGEELRTRAEIKNVNSVRFVMQAIEFEARRQVELYEDGGEVTQETRLYDPNTGETRSMRSKEEAHDYRYFPDPDLLPLDITQDFVDEISATLPELPDAKKARFIDAYGLSAGDAAQLVAEQETADYFEVVVSAGGDAKLAANWTIHELSAVLNKQGLDIGDSPVDAEALGKLVGLIADGTISGRIAKDVFEVMIDEGGDPETIVADKSLKQITDTGEIEAVIDQVIADNPEQAEQFRGGNPKVGGWFVGQVMRATGGKANPAAVNELLKKKLG